MAKNSTENQGTNPSNEQAQSSSTDTSTSEKGKRFQKVRENKPLFGTLIVVGLIGLSALGVGAYTALNDSENDDNTEIASEENANTSENSSSEQTEENSDSENSSDSNSNQEGNEDSSNSNEENDNGSENSSDSEENNSSEEQEENSSTEEEQENNEQEENSNGESNSDNNSNQEGNEDSSNSNGEQANGNENSSENGNVSTNGALNTTSTGHSSEGANKSTQNIAEMGATGIWKATDYQKGDITGNSYKVHEGDTLWEIAEGAYGDGFMWVQILNANSGQVGFLPDGSQALIFPNTTLVIPR